MIDFLKKHNQQKILLYGYPKSGNTWVRFLIFNYFNLINNPKYLKTLTFDELNEIQSNVMDRGTTNNNLPGFPLFYRTHKVYNDCYKLFDFKIFVEHEVFSLFKCIVTTTVLTSVHTKVVIVN